ncbi:DUF2851 family protein [soil metagenome]
MPTRPPRRQHRELELSQAWAEGRLPGELRLVDGRRAQIVYPGVWSNSDGPDFRNAMISISGSLQTGSVELHIRSSDWRRHGHDTDPAYDDVILHAVVEDDAGEPVRSANGTTIPTLELGGIVQLNDAPTRDRRSSILAALGSRTCLPTLGVREPDRIRTVLRSSGWKRLVEKQLRFGQSLQALTAPEVLYRGILDALGYSANREPMARIGELIPLTLLEATGKRTDHDRTLAVLLGIGGFLPLSPQTIELCGIQASERELEECFQDFQSAYRLESVSATAWSLNRVRPANHPAARLASLASLIQSAQPDGLFARYMSFPLDAGKSWDGWLAGVKPSIGTSRRRQIVVNVFAPFLAAYAEVTRDEMLAEQVGELWESLPGSVSDRVARAARQQIVGDAKFPIRLALEEQGLHDIHRNGCSQLRCFECPIAALAIKFEPWEAGVRD